MSTETNDGITIRTMTVQDYKKVKPFIEEHFFASAPLLKAITEQELKCQEEKITERYTSMIEQGTCLVAIDGNNPGRIVGIVLACAQYASDLEKQRQNAVALDQSTWSNIRRMLLKMELETNVFERFSIPKVLYSHVTAVDTAMRGKGLGSRLAAALMEVGRTKNFPMMIAYCISYYSARQKEALGMECIHSLAYADYKDEEGLVIFQPAQPHTEMRVLVKKLL